VPEVYKTDRRSVMKQVTIDGIEYVSKEAESDVKIVVLHRGWVVVGRLQPHGDEPERVLTNASVIRVWGTTRGLGELAAGPTKDTILDKAGVVRYHELAAVLTIDCEDTAWTSL